MCIAWQREMAYSSSIVFFGPYHVIIGVIIGPKAA